MRRKLKSFGHKPDMVLLSTFFALIVLGFIFLASASFDIGKIDYNDAYYFLKHQLIFGFVPGVLMFLVGYLTYYRNWRKFSPILFFLNLILLVMVLTPMGTVINGSRRWISLFGLSFQPSELLKFTLILYLATLFSSTNLRKIKHKDWRIYWLFICFLVITALLISLQPATTMAVIILSASVIIYFVSGARYKFILLTALVGIIGISFLAIVTPYRFNRIAPIWNKVISYLPGENNSIAKIEGIDTFHPDQTVISIGSGGLFGVGFGKSTSKYNLLPEPMNDSIFAVVAEETGFVGAMLIIILYFIFFIQALKLAKRSHDNFAKLLLVGFSSVIAIQAIIHISANSGILPFTGIPLPFISYGGTSFAVLALLVGVMANISKHTAMK